MIVGAPYVIVGAPYVIVGAPHVNVGAPHVIVGAPHVIVGARRIRSTNPLAAPHSPQRPAPACRRRICPSAPGRRPAAAPPRPAGALECMLLHLAHLCILLPKLVTHQVSAASETPSHLIVASDRSRTAAGRPMRPAPLDVAARRAGWIGRPHHPKRNECPPDECPPNYYYLPLQNAVRANLDMRVCAGCWVHEGTWLDTFDNHKH